MTFTDMARLALALGAAAAVGAAVALALLADRLHPPAPQPVADGSGLWRNGQHLRVLTDGTVATRNP